MRLTLVNAGRQEPNNEDYAYGQLGGDIAAVAVGAQEVSAGVSTEVGGIVLDSTGAGAVLGVPANVAGAGLIVHGGSAVITGLVNVMESIKKPGSSGGPTAGKNFPEAVKTQSAAEARGKCENCGVPLGDGPGKVKANTDHIIPKSKGGNATPANAQTTCETCNKSAGANPKPKTTGADKVQRQ